MSIQKLYVASPLGFSEAGRYFMDSKLLPLIKKLGYTIIDPWKLTPENKIKKVEALEYGKDKKNQYKKLNSIIAHNNAMGIDLSDGILAVLDGVDVDSGTASEIGYAAAKSKLIIGYRGDFRLSSDNEGSIVNLQVEYFIISSGGLIVKSLSELEQILKKVKL